MTKKDYQLIANAIAKTAIDMQDLKKQYPNLIEILKEQEIGISRLTNYLIGELYAENPKFSTEKFLDYILEKQKDLIK